MDIGREQELLLQIAALTAERDLLLAEKEGTQKWLGQLLYGSPIQPIDLEAQTIEQRADELVREFPEKKIQAIKELRSWSQVRGVNHSHMTLGLKEAKDAIDLAYARAGANQGMTSAFGTGLHRSVIQGYRQP